MSLRDYRTNQMSHTNQKVSSQIHSRSQHHQSPSQNSNSWRESFRPFLSLMIIIATLLSICFFKMEIRREGYSVLILSRQERRLRDQQRQQMLFLAKITRPERVQALAQNRLTLKRAESGQIIQMTSQGIALKQ